MTALERYFMYISYLGTGFSGSQIQCTAQPGTIIRTIQGTVEEALKRYFKLPKNERQLRTIFSSRTDTGVHALRTGFHVDLPPLYGQFVKPDSVKLGLNKLFSSDPSATIRILDVFQVTGQFHARHSCRGKLYMYRVGVLKPNLFVKDELQNVVPISEIGRTHFVRTHSFDKDKVLAATELFLGKRDFRGIIGKASKFKVDTVCDIESFTMEPAEPLLPICDPVTQMYNYYNFYCRGSRFLFHMVRRMVSIALAVGRDIIPLDTARKLIDRADPDLWDTKIRVVSGNGLYLVNIFFDEDEMAMMKKPQKENSLEDNITEVNKEAFKS